MMPKILAVVAAVGVCLVARATRRRMYDAVCFLIVGLISCCGVSYGADQMTITLAEGWHAGPLPAGTYFYGGVVVKGRDPNAGFFFADFRGDHVLIDDGGRVSKRVDANDVAFWNNELKVPIIAKKQAAADEGLQTRSTPQLSLAVFDGSRRMIQTAAPPKPNAWTPADPGERAAYNRCLASGGTNCGGNASGSASGVAGPVQRVGGLVKGLLSRLAERRSARRSAGGLLPGLFGRVFGGCCG